MTPSARVPSLWLFNRLPSAPPCAVCVRVLACVLADGCTAREARQGPRVCWPLRLHSAHTCSAICWHSLRFAGPRCFLSRTLLSDHHEHPSPADCSAAGCHWLGCCWLHGPAQTPWNWSRSTKTNAGLQGSAAKGNAVRQYDARGARVPLRARRGGIGRRRPRRRRVESQRMRRSRATWPRRCGSRRSRRRARGGSWRRWRRRRESGGRRCEYNRSR